MEPTAEDRRRQDGLLIASVVLTVMAGIFVILRSISRFVLIRTPGADDYFIIAAMLLTIGYLIELFLLKGHHLGFPMSFLTLDDMVAFLKITLGIQVMYYTNIFCIKVSILLTYLRFAVSSTFRILCWATIALHTVFFLICLIVTLAQCRPLEKMWDLTGVVDGSCINTTAFFYFTSSFNILTDIWILAMPFKTLRSIQRPAKEKVALFIIFGVGAFAAVASVVRLHTIYIYTLAEDPFRDGLPINLWSMIEVSIAISCASVSALKPIFSSKQRKASRASKSTPSGTPSQNTSKYMNSRATNGPRQHARLASLDDSSVRGVMHSRTSNAGDEEKAHDSDTPPESWAVPASLRQAPPVSRPEPGKEPWDNSVELTFLGAGSEGTTSTRR